ncbi:RNA-directed DNA polymerase, eukaryota [Tanacetum coccineum]
MELRLMAVYTLVVPLVPTINGYYLAHRDFTYLPLNGNLYTSSPLVQLSNGIRTLLVELSRHGYAVSSLMDTAYWSSEYYLFNTQGENAFNNFIAMSGLVDIPLEGFAFTWAHKSATKMSKLDRFLISEGLMVMLPHLSALCLDRHLSDHRPILLRELSLDYGPTPFQNFHSWFKLKDFDKVMEESWKSSHFEESNEQSEELESGVSYDEIKKAVWECGSNKSPGQDGFSFKFFRKYWKLINVDVVAAVQDFFVTSKFPREWSDYDIKTIMHVLKCFFLASGLKINLHKSKLTGIGVSPQDVIIAANVVGCMTFTTPFNYLGVKVRDIMSRGNSWAEIILKLSSRLSKWKLKTLSSGGRLTLIKSVLTVIPLYHMSIFKVPICVLNNMESIRRNFFNGVEGSDRKLTWIAWKNVLASKEKGGLRVSSYFALNRALLFKWVWHFISQDSSLWSKFIKAIHGAKGSLDNVTIASIRSHWLAILREVSSLKSKAIDLLSYARRKVGNKACWDNSVPNDLSLRI